jgi:hypothetical protein
VRHEEREVWLSHLTTLDFYVSYWSEGLVGHTFLSFIFDNAPPLSISLGQKNWVFRQTSGRFVGVSMAESPVDIGFQAFRRVFEFGIGSGWQIQ